MNILPGASWRVNLKPVIFMVIIHIHTLILEKGRWGKYLTLTTVWKHMHDCNFISDLMGWHLLWESMCSDLTHCECSLSIQLWLAVCILGVCGLVYIINCGWAWLAVSLAGLVTKHAPAASRAKGRLKPALSIMSSHPLAVCRRQAWGAGLKE